MKALAILVALVLLCCASAFIFLLVHRSLEHYYIALGRRYCRKNHLLPSDWMISPKFDEVTGIKTEFSIVELLCQDNENRDRYVQLEIGLFGVRKVLSNEVLSE